MLIIVSQSAVSNVHNTKLILFNVDSEQVTNKVCCGVVL